MRRRRAILWLAAVGAPVMFLVWLATLRWTLIVHLNNAGAVAGLYNGTVFWSNVQLPAGYVMIPGPVIVQEQPAWIMNIPRYDRFYWLPRWWNQPIGTILAIPLWAPLACVLAPEAIGRALRCRRHAPDRCATCGYDLKGLGDSSKCPECGSTSRTRA